MAALSQPPTHGPTPTAPYPCWPEYAARRARAAVLTPLQQQAANGMVLDQTVWNHHFQQYTKAPDELHSSGVSLINRLARRHINMGTPGPLHLYLQTATDVDFRPGNMAEFTRIRTERNQKRLEMVHGCLATLYPELQVVVHVHNPAPVGMNEREVLQTINQLELQASRGYLTQDVLAGIEISSVSKSGGGLPPPAVAPPSIGTGGSGTLGAEAGAAPGAGAMPGLPGGN